MFFQLPDMVFHNLGKGCFVHSKIAFKLLPLKPWVVTIINDTFCKNFRKYCFHILCNSADIRTVSDDVCNMYIQLGHCKPLFAVKSVGNNYNGQSVIFLGVQIDENLIWKRHISPITRNVSNALFLIKRAKHCAITAEP